MGSTLLLMVGVHRKCLNGPLLEWGAEPCSTHHGKEVVIAFDLGGHLGELLVKCIGDVVGWVGGDDQNALPPLGELDCQAAAGQGKGQKARGEGLGSAP